MPKVKKGKSYVKRYDERNIDEAIDAIKLGMSIKSAARTFKVPRQTLQYRLSDKFKKCGHGPQPVLSLQEENTLVEWILDCHKKGFPRRKQDIQVSVKNYLHNVGRKTIFKDNLPGDKWMNLFLKRHPNLSFRTAEAVTSSSGQVSEKDIKGWFQNIEGYLNEKGLSDLLLDPSRIYNGDETAFCFNPKQSKVIALKGSKDVYEVDSGPAKLNLTVMFSFSASGDTTHPMIIFPYKRMPKSIVDTVPNGWGIGNSENGWMKSELFYEYIGNVFYKSLVNQGIIFPVILFVDGHKTHMTLQLSELCTKLQIILIALYPNATRILQPADVAAFRPIKNDWKKVVLEWRLQNPGEQLSKFTFAPLLKKVVDNVKASTIKNGFRACGLFPWDPNALDYRKCLGRIKNNQETNDIISIDEGALTCQQFCAIVGEETVDKLRAVKNEEVLENNFKILYKLWKIVNKQKVQKNIETSRLNQEKKEYSEQILLSDSVTNKSDADADTINNSYSYLRSTMQTNIEDGDTTFNIEDIPIIIVPETTDWPEIIIDETILSLEKNDHNNFKPSEDSTNEIRNYLTWPETPHRKNKNPKKGTEKMPYVITSSGWKKIFCEKKLTKENIELEKEKRKEERLKLKSIKEEKQKSAKANKQKKKINKSKLKNNENDANDKNEMELENNKENDGIEENCKNPEGNDNKKICIISDYKIEPQCTIINKKLQPQKPSHVKNLFKNNEDLDTPEDTESTVEPNIYKVTSGLCYTCCFNINSESFGVKCMKCQIRQYHKICLQKYKKCYTNFVCEPCKKTKK